MPGQTDKQQILDALARHVAARKPTGDFAVFAAGLYAAAPPADLAPVAVERLHDSARRLWTLSAQRPAGAPLILIDNPDDRATAAPRRTSILIVNDDMPFLVDSITGAMGAMGHDIALLLHPILEVARDQQGRRRGCGGLVVADQARAQAMRAESLIYIEIDRRDEATRTRLLQELQRVLADVHAAVADWRPMLGRINQVARDLEATPGARVEDAVEAVALLDWLADNHFTLLGYRYFGIDGEVITLGDGLGILRDPDRMIWRGAEGFTHMPPELRYFLRSDAPLLITKANVKSNVHRRVHIDYIGVKAFDADGGLIGEHRFVGLFTSVSYSRPARTIPVLRRKLDAVTAQAGFSPNSHAGKALAHILESYPRDELFQTDDDSLYETALGILYLQERPRPKVFARPDPFHRFVAVLAFIPREIYTSELRAKAGEAIAAAYRGEISTYYATLSQEPIARIHYIIRTRPGRVPKVDPDALDALVADIFKGWDQRLREALIAAYGEEEGYVQFYLNEKAFSTLYREGFSADDAVIDLARLDALGDPDRLGFRLYRRADDAASVLRLKIYRAGGIVALSDCLPMLEHLGLKVIEEIAYEVNGGDSGWIHDFLLEDRGGRALDVATLAGPVEQALEWIAEGKIDDDGMNALILAAGIDADQAMILRGYGRYLRQIGLGYSQEYIEACLVRFHGLAGQFVRLFLAQFDPKIPARRREGEAEALAAALKAGFDAVTSIDHDRILRGYLEAIRASVRTNYFQRDDQGVRPAHFAVKLLSGQIRDMPKPVPYAEIFVFGPRVEGIHLRGGKVARGGLRWSDRREDYRTEILGLVKAQMVKNAVIVPVGAKGGFIPRLLPVEGGRDAVQKEGIAAYQAFVTALLELTDNLVEGGIKPPADTVRRDDDDPYLVVAADKGTASFSDIANAIAVSRGFWLGDAFASGGSQGYDHKKMAITARGAWISVQRHFREAGVNVQTDPVRVVGVGDMSGDVFGNGMLLSRAIKLVAAFDHRHIFLDPNPDPGKSFTERQRLFDLPRSSWADYDKKLISKGGGVFDRAAKSLALSPEVRAMLDIEAEQLAPAQLIKAILRARADLLWFGGIGTYVKAAYESHADVGDRANDPVRVNAEEIRVKIVGEGANLGVTQKARIAFARKGGRINTDFIDNSAGVDCSDNEVNLKIALSHAVAEATIDGPGRDALLVRMTDDVAALVLRDNYLQTQAISIAEAEAGSALDRHARLIRWLEKHGLDREVEGLPNDDAITELAARHQGLSRPEIAVLLAYAKIALYDALKDSRLLDAPWCEAELFAAFPQTIHKRFGGAIRSHRLRREIIATKLANALVNRGGLSTAFDLAAATGHGLDEIAACFLIVREVFDLRLLWRGIDRHDYQAPASIQIKMQLACGAALRRQMAWMLGHLPRPIDIDAAIERYQAGVRAVMARPQAVLGALEAEAFTAQLATLARQGVPEEVAAKVAALEILAPVCDIVAAAATAGRGVVDVGAAFFELGHQLGIDWLAAAAQGFTGEDHWQRLAAQGIIDDLGEQQRSLTRRALEQALKAKGKPAVARFVAREADLVRRARDMVEELRGSGPPTIAKLGYATRQLRTIFGTPS